MTLKQLLDKFGEDRYWQDDWSPELAKLIRRNFKVRRKRKQPGGGVTNGGD